MQKLWPHGVDEGLVNTSRQMEHWNCSSDRKLPWKDILPTARQEVKYRLFIPSVQQCPGEGVDDQVHPLMLPELSAVLRHSGVSCGSFLAHRTKNTITVHPRGRQS